MQPRNNPHTGFCLKSRLVVVRQIMPGVLQGAANSNIQAARHAGRHAHTHTHSMDLGGKRQKIRRDVSLGDFTQEAAFLKHVITLARQSEKA